LKTPSSADFLKISSQFYTTPSSNKDLFLFLLMDSSQIGSKPSFTNVLFTDLAADQQNKLETLSSSESVKISP
jgi:hypothetical protein